MQMKLDIKWICIGMEELLKFYTFYTGHRAMVPFRKNQKKYMYIMKDKASRNNSKRTREYILI